jgi:hypothetical protein
MIITIITISMNALLRYITGHQIEEGPSVDLTSDKSGEGSTSVSASSTPSMGQCIAEDLGDDNGVDEDDTAGCSGSSGSNLELNNLMPVKSEREKRKASTIATITNAQIALSGSRKKKKSTNEPVENQIAIVETSELDQKLPLDRKRGRPFKEAHKRRVKKINDEPSKHDKSSSSVSTPPSGKYFSYTASPSGKYLFCLSAQALREIEISEKLAGRAAEQATNDIIEIDDDAVHNNPSSLPDRFMARSLSGSSNKDLSSVPKSTSKFQLLKNSSENSNSTPAVEKKRGRSESLAIEKSKGRSPKYGGDVDDHVGCPSSSGDDLESTPPAVNRSRGRPSNKGVDEDNSAGCPSSSGDNLESTPPAVNRSRGRPSNKGVDEDNSAGCPSSSGDNLESTPPAVNRSRGRPSNKGVDEDNSAGCPSSSMTINGTIMIL